MPDSGFSIRLFTLDEANALLPRVRELVRCLRESKRRIVATQARLEIEEMTGPVSGSGSWELWRTLGAEMEVFHGYEADLARLGCELKDLERGLVDFYSVRGNAVVYLCWMHGEDSIGWWHDLDAGVRNRMPV